MQIFDLHAFDFYKSDHRSQYPDNTESVYSGWTARSAKHAQNLVLPDFDNRVVLLGLQSYIQRVLVESWSRSFFDQPFNTVVNRYKRRMDNSLGEGAVDTAHLKELHDLGYMPLIIKALPEGSRVNIGVPMFTVKETDPRFFWLTNYIESDISCEVWKPCTTATIAYEYKRLLERYAMKTVGNTDFVPVQAHDFSYRGMSCREDAARSGAGHLLSFLGTDSVLAIDHVEEYYNAELPIGVSVPATEHSVMCMGTKDGEKETIKRLIQKIYPTGIVSIVSDTWDFWNTLTVTAPELKQEILNREPNSLGLAKVVFRPDSGDPADIICGTAGVIEDLSEEVPKGGDLPSYCEDMLSDIACESQEHGEMGVESVSVVVKWHGNYYEITGEPFWNRHDKRYYYYDGMDKLDGKKIELTNEQKGAVECLWDDFGGTVSDQGYRVLNERVGLIYGDSITLERAQDILQRLEAKGFASTNVVLGIGSYTYQYLTRDTFGFAMKATHGVVNGENRPIFKDPATDDGTKKSAKGLMRVEKSDNGFQMFDMQTEEQEASGLLGVVFENGEFARKQDWNNIMENLNA